MYIKLILEIDEAYNHQEKPEKICFENNNEHNNTNNKDNNNENKK